MTRAARLGTFALPALLLLATGCGDVTPETTSINATPDGVLEPEAPATAAAPADEPDAAAPAAEPTSADGTAAAPADDTAATVAAVADDPAEDTVAMERLDWEAFQKRLAEPGAKYTLVDAWASNCGPCKENFPHLVAMSKSFQDKGLRVMSLSLDDPEDAAALAEAERFLGTQDAEFTHVLLDEEFGVGYEKLRVNAIPAVFVYGPDGQEVKRFTLDDVDNQFTYDQVEREVAALLGDEPAAAGDGE